MSTRHAALMVALLLAGAGIRVREGGFFVVVLAGDQAVVQAAKEPSEQVALGGGVAVAVAGFAARDRVPVPVAGHGH